jgi:hypothetical protein
MEAGRAVHVKGLRIATRCLTTGEFVAKFHRFCEDAVIFIPHANRPVGSDTAFSFDLASGGSALCGLGTVLDLRAVACRLRDLATVSRRFRCHGQCCGTPQCAGS